MDQSLFLEIVGRYFPKLVVSYTNLINGKDSEVPYYHLRFLRPQFSITGQWESVTNYNRRVAADVISLDSPIPLKRRPSTASISGEIPKVAIKRHLNETQLSQLQLLLGRQNDNLPEIRRILFEDTPFVIDGQYEKRELLFLQALSTGTILVDQNTNVGTGVRVDFGYLPANQFNASVVWGNTGYTPLSDLADMVAKSISDGKRITRFMLDRATFNQIAMSDEAKALVNPWAAVGNGSGLFAPTQEQLNMSVEAQWGYRFEIIERTVEVEINGVYQTVTPWSAGQIIGVNNENLGVLVHSRVAEMDFPVGGVMYQRSGVGGEILVKKYRTVEPALSESTASESRWLPVLSDVDRIYKLDSTTIA